jgi:hypothetical protein
VIAATREYAAVDGKHAKINNGATKMRFKKYRILILQLICASQIFATTSSFSQTSPTFADQANKCGALQRYCAWGCNARRNHCNLCVIDFSHCMNRARSKVNFVEN